MRVGMAQRQSHLSIRNGKRVLTGCYEQPSCCGFLFTNRGPWEEVVKAGKAAIPKPPGSVSMLYEL